MSHAAPESVVHANNFSRFTVLSDCEQASSRLVPCGHAEPTCSLMEASVDAEERPDQAPTVQLDLFASVRSLSNPKHALGKNLLQEDSIVDRAPTGVPIFMSIEQSDYQRMIYYPQPIMQKTLFTFTTILELPEVRQHAPFEPNGHNGFFSNLTRVTDLDSVRRDCLGLASRPRHRPRHDIESLFWTILWAVVRANPLYPTQAPSMRDVDAHVQFCDAMLRHYVSGSKFDERSVFLEHRGHLRDDLVHPDIDQFGVFGELFENMACYLAHPWHHYEQLNMVEDNHAHVAFRHLILHFLLTADPQTLGLLFNCDKPRVFEYREDDTKDRWTLLHESAAASYHSLLRDSQRQSPFLSRDGKRKATDTLDRDHGAVKKVMTKKVASMSDAFMESTPEAN